MQTNFVQEDGLNFLLSGALSFQTWRTHRMLVLRKTLEAKFRHHNPNSGRKPRRYETSMTPAITDERAFKAQQYGGPAAGVGCQVGRDHVRVQSRQLLAIAFDELAFGRRPHPWSRRQGRIPAVSALLPSSLVGNSIWDFE